ncbi:MAG: sigma-70 family RNA polymerase sigma factor [Kiloniellales bacterium]|nr:sigma-70 family RNA polymerase sigma factor [Kiloniellales bacterium]
MSKTILVSSSQAQDEDDHELVQRVACNRDRAAFRCLFLRFGPRVKSLMIRSGADASMAEDLVQDVMLILWRKAELYSPERGSVAAWVFTIARNLRIDRLRRQSPQAYDDIDDLDFESPAASGEEEVHVRQQSMLVSEAVSQLPPDQKRVIELSFIYDMPQADIAQELGVPLGTVKSRMRLAYGKLRERLEDVK